ncbi:MAG: AraC family transcriptional regulator [Rhodospirillales bacterium]|nr:AraC family transcriptional regulator [Rhodospirillales bacterium]
MDDPSVNRNIESWAADLGVSRRTLTRLVKSETGIGWREWRQRLLMAEAARRLAAGGLVKTIAYDLGYAGAAPFIAAFRRLYGISPGRAYSRKTQK